jgi:hypothetical protein
MEHIYESPDGGLTTYARLQGSTERVMIGQSWEAKELIEKRMCAYFVKEISRQSEVVDYGKIW